MKEKSITESMLGGADARRHPPPPDVLGYPAVLDHGLAARRAASIFRFAAPIARAARRVRPGLILLGLATDTAPLQSVLRFAGPQRWNIVDVLRDDLPEHLVRVRELVCARAVDTLILCMSERREARIRCLSEQLADLPVRIYICTDPGSIAAAGATTLRSGRLPFPELLPPPLGIGPRAVKRLFDLAFVVAALPLLAPVLAVAAIAIRLETPGPILFSQWRFGRGNKAVLIWKFRTMYADRGDPTGAQRTLKRDPRVTKIGRLLRRTSIDELPQLLNVLRGEMSLVGPRPHALQMRVDGVYYQDAVAGYHGRHRVKPGLNGWAQINGSRGEVDTLAKAKRRIEMDLWYIDRWSFALDVWIVLRTVFGGFASPQAD